MDLAATFNDVFLATSNPFAETVTYTAYGTAAVEINAIVKRGGFITSKQKADNTKSLYDYELIVSAGDIEKVTVNMDKVVLVAPQYGVDSTNTYIIAGIVGKTPMAWHLGLKG